MNNSFSLEYQRYGRNKDTQINKTYIESGEYRRKFDKITDDANLARLLYNKAKEMLYHRSGTEYEDMYWIDSNTCEVIASVTDELETEQITYTSSILDRIKKNNNIIAIHNHPHGMPPSVEDINSCAVHGYLKGIIVCNNGIIFEYISECVISEILYDMYYRENVEAGNDEYNSQLLTLIKLMENYSFSIKEVES